MICLWCGKGEGRRFTKDKNGKVHYYVCFDCVGFYIEEQDKQAKALLEDDLKKVKAQTPENICSECGKEMFYFGIGYIPPKYYFQCENIDCKQYGKEIRTYKRGEEKLQEH